MAKYWVLHDFGAPEGLKIQAECDSIPDAVTAREHDLSSCGGSSYIVEVIDVLYAYSVAANVKPNADTWR